MLSFAVSEHLMLRTYTPNDATELFTIINRNRAHLRPWLDWVDATTKEEHSLAFINDSLRQLHHQEGMALGIFLEGKLIGALGMSHWNHTLKKAQIGYWIGKEHEGSGVLSTCLKQFICFLFEKLELNKIEIWFVVTNKRSAVVAQRFGAKIEGILRSSQLVNGNLEDVVIAGILKREWTSNS